MNLRFLIFNFFAVFCSASKCIENSALLIKVHKYEWENYGSNIQTGGNAMYVSGFVQKQNI